MGVVYKLTPDISKFIIEQKQNEPKVSCQNLSGRVFLQFGEHVSKSSVHELLKQAHVITPRKHKIKDKFKIPVEKKAEISKALAPFIEKPALPRIRSDGEIFLKAALWDLSIKPVFKMKDNLEIDSSEVKQTNLDWEYLNQLVYAIKIETPQNNFYIDPRFQGIYLQNPNSEQLGVPIERAAYELADHLLNNVEPLIIRRENTTYCLTDLYEFLSAMDQASDRGIKNISLIGKRERSIVEFNAPLAHRREFILGISSKCQEIQGFIENPSIDMSLELGLEDKAMMLRYIKKDDINIITNCRSISYEEVFEKYVKRHPPGEWALALSQPAILFSGSDAMTLKNKLKDRAKMFFPKNFSKEFLERVLALGGYEVAQEDQIQVCLTLPKTFEEVQTLEQAVQNINHLYIRDFKGRKRTVSLVVS